VTFEQVVDQAIAMLQRRGRVTYHMLKRQFALDDASFADLKDAILYAYPRVVADEGGGLVWTGDPAAPEPDAPRRAEAESRFQAMLSAVMWWLQRDRRVTYRTLKHILGLDDALLQEIREELTFSRLAIDEDGKGLVWTGKAPPVHHTPVEVPIQPAAADTTVFRSPTVSLSPPVTDTLAPSHGPTVPADVIAQNQHALPPTPNAARSRCCSATWSTRPDSPGNSMPKTIAPWCVPTSRWR
jgi:hypothetical protein